MMIVGIIITAFMIPSYQFNAVWNLKCTLDFMVLLFGCFLSACLCAKGFLTKETEIFETYVSMVLAMALIFICKTNGADKWISSVAWFFFQEFGVFILGVMIYNILAYEKKQLGEKSLLFSAAGVSIGCFFISYCSFMELAVQNPIFLLNLAWAIGLIPTMILFFSREVETDEEVE